MNLYIRENTTHGDINGKDYYLSIDSLKYNGTHLFIASNHWEELHITINENISLNILKYIRMVVDKVIVTIDGEQTKHIMELMCELYPEKSGSLHKAFMMGKDLKGVVVDDS